MIKVYKFGGSLLNSVIGFEQLTKIMLNSIEVLNNTNTTNNNIIENKTIIVISAFGKTTAKLGRAAKLAEQGFYNEAINIVDDIFNYHILLSNELKLNSNNIKIFKELLEDIKQQIIKLIRGVYITQVLTLRTKDMILSFGEIIASQFVSLFLIDRGIKNLFFNISEILVTDNNFGNANPNISATKQKFIKHFIPLIAQNNCIITQGFIASSITGEVTTMGMESSNLTATIIAGILKADEFIIWTDVEGIRSGDPKLFKNTILLKNISYDFAEILALYGVKLLYPKMIKYMRLFDLSVKFCSGININGESTMVDKKGDDNKYEVLIYKENITLLYKKLNNNYDDNYNLSINYDINYISKIPNKITLIADNIERNTKNNLIINGYNCIENICGLIGINLLANCNLIDYAVHILNDKNKKLLNNIEEILNDYDGISKISRNYFFKKDKVNS